MATIEYSVAGQQIVVTKDEKLVENTIGIYTVGFTFDAASWGDFTQKTAVFVHEDYPDTPPYEVPIDDGEAPIPAAVLKYGNIMIGVYGSTQTQQYPTIWAPAKRVWPGAGPGVEPPEDPVFGMVVRTAPQELTEEQQEIARTNIGAAPEVIPDSTPGNITIIGSNGNIVDSGKSLADLYDAAMISKTASGSIVTIEDGADGVPVKEMTVNIQPVQDGSGDPSPSNVRSIHGLDGVSIRRTAKNLCGGEAFKTDLVKAMPNIALDETAKTATFYANATYTGSSLFDIKWKPQTRYTFVIAFSKSSNDATNMRISYTDGTYENLASAYGSYNTKLVKVVTSAANKTISKVIKVYQSGAITLWYDECGVFEGVLTASDFEPYNGNTCEIEFPASAGTVYGGELTVNEDGTGTLTVDMVGRYLSTLTWTANATAHAFNGEGFTERKKNIDGVGTSLCDRYKFYTSSQVGSADYGIALANSNSTPFRIYVRDIRFDTVAQFTESLAANDVFVLCPALNPVTYELTAEQVKTLKGLNNIWADTGDISITYRADPTIASEEQAKAIKASIAYLQDDFTAVRPYVVNDLVYVGDTLYIVTSAIAQGATMTPNTNCAETTLNAVIKSLR